MPARARGPNPELGEKSGASGALLERARNGSRSALGQLLAAARPRLGRWVRIRIGQDLARKVDASDVVQEAQLVAIANIKEFRGHDLRAFHAWLRTILGNQLMRALRFCRELRRDHRREQPLSPASGSGEIEEIGPATNSPSDQLSRKEEREQLMLALSWSPEEDRVLISLQLFEGHGHHEIAMMLGVPVNTARQRYSRAVRRLGKALKLMARLDGHNVHGPRQEAIVRHCTWRVPSEELGEQLGLPEELVSGWIAEAGKLLLDDMEDKT
jgi:RNA polymerase sigma-70 factor (subfamily 1)